MTTKAKLTQLAERVSAPFFRGLLNGLALSLSMWAVIALTAWQLWPAG
jgi:hypothetical protein